jgi:RNA polymerase sigma-70 factor (ECF subfamily)
MTDSRREPDPTVVSPLPLPETQMAAAHQSATTVYQTFGDAIRRFCANYLKDEAAAQDVVQETFAKLATAEAPPAGELKPWLYRVARNRCLDLLRRRQVSPTYAGGMRTGFDAAGSTAGPGTRLAREERQRLIGEIIDRMPDEYRSVLLLKHVENLSRAEIAAALEISEAAVKGRLVRGAEYLSQELAQITGIAR